MGNIPFTSGIARALVPNRDVRLRSATRYLVRQASAQGFPSYIADNVEFRSRQAAAEEMFSSSLVLEAFADGGLEAPDEQRQIERVESAFTSEGLMHFFADKSLLVADVDCTAVSLELMVRHQRRLPFDLHATLDSLAANTDSRGVLRVYLGADASRMDRIDPVVCINALYLFYLMGREADVAASEDLVWEHLNGPDFAKGTRYYPSPDIFLFFLSRLVRRFEAPRSRFASVLEQRVRERLGAEADPLATAARITAAESVGLLAESELGQLLEAQRPDGSWPAAPCFRLGRRALFFGGESLSTAWAVRALTAVEGDVSLRRDAQELHRAWSEVIAASSTSPQAKRSA